MAMTSITSLMFHARNNICPAFAYRYSSSVSKARVSSSGNSGAGNGYSNSNQNYRAIVGVGLASLSAGFFLGRNSFRKPHEDELVLPKGLPRSCCDSDETSTLTPEQQDLVKTLKRIVGKKYLLDGRTENTQTTKYLKGARLGHGTALAIVQPQTLKQVVECVEAVVDSGCVVLVQGSNTGLTGGSVPREQSDGRPTVVISMKLFDQVFPIDNGKRVVCMAGVGLADLLNWVTSNFPDRESHSVLGSTFLNPTTAAGVAFGSGGTQCRKGPAWTERALYLKVDHDKYHKPIVKVVNTLGIKGLDGEEGEFVAHKRYDGLIPSLDKYLKKIQDHDGESALKMKTSNHTYGKNPAHDLDYKERLCKYDNEVSRFNADTKGCDCNRSEGKVVILASVHDTFPTPPKAKTYWLSFDSLDTALRFKRDVCLDNPDDVPVSIEYMDRDAFDVIDSSARIMGTTIKLLGTTSALVNKLWEFKLWVEALDVTGASTIMDKLMFLFNPIFPPVLPSTIMKMGREKDHHIAITIGDFDGSLNRFEERFAKFQSENEGKVETYEVQKPMEKAGVTSFRFIAAPAFRTYCVGMGLQGVSVDYALPKNHGEVPVLPTTNQPVKRMRYSHFACNVVHEDLAYDPGVDTHAAKMELKGVVDHDCHGKLPAGKFGLHNHLIFDLLMLLTLLAYSQFVRHHFSPYLKNTVMGRNTTPQKAHSGDGGKWTH